MQVPSLHCMETTDSVERRKKNPQKLKQRSFLTYSGVLSFPILHSRAYSYTYVPLFPPFRCLIYRMQYCYKSKKTEAWTKVSYFTTEIMSSPKILHQILPFKKFYHSFNLRNLLLVVLLLHNRTHKTPALPTRSDTNRDLPSQSSASVFHKWLTKLHISITLS